MTIRQIIRTRVESVAGLVYRPTDDDPREVLRLQNAILRQCKAKAEREFVMSTVETAPTKTTPGREPDREIDSWASKVRKCLPAHGGNIKSAAREVLEDHIQKTFAGDDASATRFFNRVCKRTYVLKQKCEKPLRGSKFLIAT